MLWFASNLSAQEPLIRSIEVEGTSELETSQILFSISSQIDEPIDQQKIIDDIKIIYRIGLFENVQVALDTTENNDLILRFVVEERPRIAKIQINGRTLIDQSELEEKIVLQQYDIYDVLKMQQSVTAIQELYKKEGYAKVKVLSRIEEVDAKNLAIYFEIDEFPKVYLTDIHVHGTQFYSELEIQRFILSSEIDCFSWIRNSGIYQEQRINQDLAIIAQNYLKEGFIKVFIDQPQVIMYHNPDYSRIEVSLKINEGERYNTGKVEITGDILGNQTELLELLSLETGKVYNPFLQNRDRFELSEVYQEQGYAFVRVIPRTQLNEDNRTVDVTYQIVKGEKAYISRIDIAGNRETRDYVIRREFEIQENELYNGKKLRITRENLERLGFFKPGLQLKQEREDLQDNRMRILAQVEEGNTGTFQAQLGYSDQTQFSGGVSLSKGNLFGRGQVISLSAQFGQQSVLSNYSIRFTEPRLFGSVTSGTVFLSHQQQNDSTSLERGKIEVNSYGFSFSRSIYRNTSLSLGLRATDRLFEKNEPSIFKRTVSTSLSHNTVNHPIFSTKGVKHVFSFAQTGTPLGGNTNFREYGYLYEQFWSLNESSSLITMVRVRVNLLEKIGNFDIPPEDRYRLGGIGSVRGHDSGSIEGPYGSAQRANAQETIEVINEQGDKEVLTFDKRTKNLSTQELFLLEEGGILQRVFNLELLFPLTQDENSFIRGALFFDAGNVNSESIQYELLGEEEPGFFDLRQSAGVGIRMITPMGVLRFEYGAKLDQRSYESPDKFEFSISGLF